MSLFQNINNDAALTSGPPTGLDVALNGFFVSQDGYTRCTSTGAIVNYSQGIPIDANGSVCVSQTNAIASYNNGLPFDSTGRLCIAGTAMQTVLNGLPMDNDGNLCSLAAVGVSVEQYILNNPTSAADHGTVTGAGAVTAYETIDGVNVVSVTAAAGVSTTFNFKTFAARLIPDGCLSFGIYVHDMATLSSLTLSVGDNSSFTNSFRVQLSDSSAFPTNGWYEIIVDPFSTGAWSTLTEASQRRWVNNSGSPSFATTQFTNVRCVIATDAGVACKVSFAEGAIAKREANPQIVITMDDGWSTQYTAAKPILDSYGLKSSIGIVSTLVGTSNYMTLPQLQEMAAQGHECIVHGATTLTTLPDMNSVGTEITTQRDYLINNGLAINDSEKIYLYPQNVLRGGILGVGGENLRAKLIELGFIGGRSTSVTGFMSSKYTGLGSRWIVPEIGHRAATTTEADETANVDRVILRMQQAVQLGRGVVLTFHKIVPNTPGTPPTSTIDIQVSNFDRICAAAAALIAAGQARNALLSQAIKRSIGASV